ncbi:YeeE/YedE family protein [Actibacterium pelagium]|uniref:Lipocalin n=1 Tax=Actibacterium pelagium TaxID=2029103 RepID=A0A917EKC8_9RHOB|nr:YeeE/YedE family protein [Actibacterium pelagium]GGE56739.1 lipocalin [Actibacterium pelagium]
MINDFIETIGDGWALLLAGLVVGLIFGAAAQHSRFCLRAATAEFAEGILSGRLAIWLLAFTAAVAATQGAVLLGWLDTDVASQIASTGSMSGAIIGGLMFGAGMILARGCASRLLVLSATGNLRALMTGLVLTLVAQAALRGGLAPARETLSGLWLVDGGASRDLLALTGLTSSVVLSVSLIGLALTVFWAAVRLKLQPTHMLGAVIVGASVALGWVLTYQLSQTLFDPVPVSSVTFTGPATDTLMGLVNSPNIEFSFGIGLVPGVFIGSGLMALLSGEFRIQRFGEDTPMERYLVGATLMGFGAMLAGGCAVGAGVSGGAIFSLTAWVAVFFMWVGAVMTQRLMISARRVAVSTA